MYSTSAVNELCHYVGGKCAKTDKVMTNAELAHLRLITLVYHGIEPTGCQAERKFSSLTLSVSNMRKTMLSVKVEKMISLKSNQKFIPDIPDHKEVVEARATKEVNAVKEITAVKTASRSGVAVV